MNIFSRFYKSFFVVVGILALLVMFASAAYALSPDLARQHELATIGAKLSVIKALLNSIFSGGGGLAQASSSCPSALITLLGDGCHQMYTDSSGNYIYCDGPMTKSAKDGDSVVTTGCSYSGSGSTTTTTTTTTSTCTSALIALLGDGCHWMYTNVYCDGPMTKSAKEGDSATTSGCSSSSSSSSSSGSTTSTPPSGQQQQIWNSLGLSSYIRTDADPARIEQLKSACANVPNGSYVWLPNAGDAASVDFGMPDLDKCSSSNSTTTTTSSSNSCDSALIALLGSGCHQMYYDSANNPIFCNSDMTASAKRGDSATTAGCSYSGSTGGTVVYSLNTVTDLQAVYVSSSNTVLLSWTDNSIEDEYKIWRKSDGSGWTSWGSKTRPYDDGGTLTYSDTGIVSGSTYEYMIKACANTSGCAAYDSNVASVTISGANISGDTTSPTTPGNFSVVPSSSSQMKLSWTQSTDNVSVVSYKIYRNNVAVTTVYGTVTEYIDGVAPATTYSYWISALDGAGNQSPPSSSISATTPVETVVSSILTPTGFTAVLQTSNNVALSWNDNATNENEHKIERKTSSSGWGLVGSIGIVYGGKGSYQDYSLPTGTYEYRVKACNSSGCSAYSEIASATVTGLGTSNTNYCDSALTGLLGTGCHQMYYDSANNPVFCNGEMTLSAKRGDTATTAGCSYSGSTTTTSTSCDSALTALLGTGCHQMYTDASGKYIFCDGPMTKSAKQGDTATTAGCSYSSTTYTPPAGQKEQVWNTFSLRSYIRTDASQARIDSLKASCSGVSSSANVWLPDAGVSTSPDFGMPNADKCRLASACTSSQYFDGTKCTTTISTTPTGSCPSSLITLLGTGCHYMYSDSSSNATYCDGPMTKSAKAGDSVATTGCSYSGTNTTNVPYPGDTSSCPSFSYSRWDVTGKRYCQLNSERKCDYSYPSYLTNGANYKGDNCPVESSYEQPIVSGVCSEALVTLLGKGCHQMYTDPSGNPIYCDGNMTKSARKGDTETKAGCNSETKPSTSFFAIDTYGTSPRDGDKSVGGLSRIQVKFNKEIDLTSTVGQFFSLSPFAKLTSILSGAFQFSGDKFEFTPSSPLEPNTAYQYKVFSTIKDKEGTPLFAPFVAMFTTTEEGVTKVATIEGVVKDEKGEVLSGIPIQIYKDDSRSNYFGSNYSATSAKDGTFKRSVTAGSYAVDVYTPYGRKDLTRPAPVKVSVLGSETKFIEIKFGVSAKLISGSVKFSDGTAVADAEVGAYSQESGQWRSVTTDTKGLYTLRVSGGKWIVEVRPKDSLLAKWTSARLSRGVSFTKDSSSEFEILDFTVQASNSTLKVLAMDEKEKPLVGVGIVVDAIGVANVSGDAREGALAQAQYRSSDSGGGATFTVASGRYFVRSFFPEAKGFFNAEEQEVTVGPGKTAEVKLILKKRDVSTSVTINGLARLDDGTPVSAFIWGWSEKGGSLSTVSASDGTFSQKVAPLDRWRFGAGKETGGVPYKSSDIIVEVKDSSVFVEIILAKLSPGDLPPPVTVRESATKQIVAQAEDGAKANLPPQAVAGSGTISVEVKPTVEAPSQAAAQVVSTVYDIDVRDSQGKEITNFNEDIEITIPYDEKELRDKGVDEDSFVPSYYDEKTETWIKADNFTVDKEKNIVSIRVKHLTRFALIAAADITPPSAPSGTSAKDTPGKGIVVTWKNPSRDFSHAKVYRSDEKGSLGKIIASEVTKETLADAEAYAGIAYYYLVRAVDPAGNESNNLDQVIATASQTVSKGPARVSVPGGVATKLAILRSLSVGASGEDVKTLQELLIKEGVYPDGLVTGFFGNLTRQAVIRFQEKYASEILAPVGLTKGSGLIGPGTRAKLNKLLGTTTEISPGNIVMGGKTLLRNLLVSISGEDVKTLQELLIKEGVYPDGLVTGFFGNLTRQAVIRFQEKYASEILAPAGLTHGNGFVGAGTRRKINELLK